MIFFKFLFSASTSIPRKNPPSLTKMTSPKATKSYNSSMYNVHSNTQYWSSSKIDKIQSSTNNGGSNMDILRMIFPFFDPAALESMYQDHEFDLLQTVLTISSFLLEKQQKRRETSPNYYRPFTLATPPHTPYHHNITTTGRCCSSPYCPVNSYLNLRKNSPEIMQHIPTPPLTTSSYDATMSSSAPPHGGIKKEKKTADRSSSNKKFRFSTESLLPFCESCQKFGIKGDKFCPLCGILFAE